MDESIYINARIFTMDGRNTYFEQGYLLVEGDRIKKIGYMSDCPIDLDIETIDLEGKIVMPGMICSHSHFYGQLIRGMPLKTSPVNWQQILGDMWWQVDKALDHRQCYYSALMGIVEGIHHSLHSCTVRTCKYRPIVNFYRRCERLR